MRSLKPTYTPKEVKIQEFHAYLQGELANNPAEIRVNFRQYARQNEWGKYLISLADMASVLTRTLNKANSTVEHVILDLGGTEDITPHQATRFVDSLRESQVTQLTVESTTHNAAEIRGLFPVLREVEATAVQGGSVSIEGAMEPNKVSHRV